MNNDNKVVNSNKPAFPTNARMHSDAQGISKREYFAAMAMQGILANSRTYMAGDPNEVANDAINCADELLKLLES